LVTAGFGKDIGPTQVGIDLWRLWLANQIYILMRCQNLGTIPIKNKDTKKNGLVILKSDYSKQVGSPTRCHTMASCHHSGVNKRDCRATGIQDDQIDI
jgi:hypothetical protein